MRILRITARFWRNRRGNAGMMTGLVAFPLILASGLSVEYGAYVNLKIVLDRAAASCTDASAANWQSMLRIKPDATLDELQASAVARGQSAFDAEVPASLKGVYRVEATVAKNGLKLASGCLYSATVPTVFAGLVGLRLVNISGEAKGVIPLSETDDVEPGYVLRERFDAAGAPPPGATESTFRTKYNNWAIKNVLQISPTTLFGEPLPNGDTNGGELDSSQNGAMSKKVYMTPGQYELRYYIRDRREFLAYSPVAICGSQSADVDWATDNQNGQYQHGVYSNRIGVYLEKAVGTSPPDSYSPTVNTLIDVCVQTGHRWIERSVKIRINTPADYWLAFQAEGASDGVGGNLGDIRLCVISCPGKPKPAFPWSAAASLYYDTFEKPHFYGAGRYDTAIDVAGNTWGWKKAPTEWATWDRNQVDFSSQAFTGNYALELDGSGYTDAQGGANRGIARKFLLAPGYYSLSYYYKTNKPNAPGTYCGLSTMSADAANLNGTTWDGRAGDSNVITVALDSDRLVSHPETPHTLGAQAIWKDPDGSAATLPRLPVTTLDGCTHSNVWTKRTTNIKIVRADYYWLSFRAGGASDLSGGAIDEVWLTALGDLSTTAPTPLVTIPAAGKPVGSTINLGSVEIVAQ